MGTTASFCVGTGRSPEGEFTADACDLQASAIVDGVVEVLLQGLWAVVQVQGRQVLYVLLDSLCPGTAIP